MISTTLEVVAILACIVATLYPLLTSRYYINTNELGRAQMFMFIGESMVMLVTTAFATLSITGLLPEFSHDFQSFMRIVMASIAIITSYRVHRVLKRVVKTYE